MAFKDTEHGKAYYKKWRQDNAAHIKEYLREWNKRTRPYEKKRELHLKSRFGITHAQYEIMLESQNGKCAICRTDKSNSNGRNIFAIDHDHGSGRIRGLLCFNCNSGIGHLKDSVELLERAIEYLKKYAD